MDYNIPMQNWFYKFLNKILNSDRNFLYLYDFPNLMNILDLKKELLFACVKLVDERAESLRQVMQDAQQSANDYGQPKDRYDSYRTQLLRKRDMFGQQLQKILQQKNILEKVDPKRRSDTASFGSLVMTDKQNIFISVGLGKVDLNGQSFFVISPAVPYFKAAEGKKKGDIFEFRGQKFNILDIA